ncbi:MAG: serine/threonine-protein phosphatase [Lentisphaeria bacterium]|nr:serine/threonine-protein phosphatase [Lentisphaeria bacterium]
MNINFAGLDIAGESNTGPVRHHNEDNFLIYAPPGGSAVLAAVADGIGGHSRGEVASYICCRELYNAASKLDSRKWDARFLRETLEYANERIFDFNLKGRRVKPMGCTIAAAIFTAAEVICAYAGDSRIYEFHRAPGHKPLRQLSVDHRPEGYDELQKTGRLLHTSLVSRSLGTAKFLNLDMQTVARMPDARYMLCSDGLYNRQPEQLFSGILGSDDFSARQAVNQLLRGALLAGEKDNITIICAASVPGGRKE